MIQEIQKMIDKVINILTPKKVEKTEEIENLVNSLVEKKFAQELDRLSIKSTTQTYLPKYLQTHFQWKIIGEIGEIINRLDEHNKKVAENSDGIPIEEGKIQEIKQLQREIMQSLETGRITTQKIEEFAKMKDLLMKEIWPTTTRNKEAAKLMIDISQKKS